MLTRGSHFPKHQLLALNKRLPPVRANGPAVHSLLVIDTESLSGFVGAIYQEPSIEMVIS